MILKNMVKHDEICGETYGWIWWSISLKPMLKNGWSPGAGVQPMKRMKPMK